MATKYGIQKRGTGKAVGGFDIGGVANIYGNIAQGMPMVSTIAQQQQNMFPSETNLKSQGNFQTATGQTQQQAATTPTQGPNGVTFRPLSPVTSKKGGMTKKKKK